MSPWWRELIEARLRPGRVTVRCRSRGPKRRELGRESIAVEAPAGAPTWQPLLSAFSEHLAQRAISGGDLYLTLAGSLVRYQVIPWMDNLGERDAVVYAHQLFVTAYGAVAQDWTVCMSDGVRGLPRVAVATERALVEAVRSECARLGVRLRSVQPALCTAVETLARIDRRYTGWLAMMESGHSCVARFRGGACLSVCTARYAEAPAEHLLTQVTQQMLNAESDAAPGQLYIEAAVPLDYDLLRSHGWRVLPLESTVSA